VKDNYDILDEWRRSRCQSNRPEGSHAPATFVCVDGSSYRRPGARMLIWSDGKTIASLGAGCLEEVMLCAREGDTAGSFDSAWFCSE
jgi:xanthine/CO dehydrogenase XdhC/CoxF family maturation factor